LAAAADGRAFARGARINDLVILITAFWATHKTTANCGCTFVTHWVLWVKLCLFTGKSWPHLMPAMEAGITDHIWNIKGIVELT
jgi:hypothetical protein